MKNNYRVIATLKNPNEKRREYVINVDAANKGEAIKMARSQIQNSNQQDGPIESYFAMKETCVPNTITALYQASIGLWFNIDTGIFDSPVPVNIIPNKYERKPHHLKHLASLSLHIANEKVERFTLPEGSLGTVDEIIKQRKVIKDYKYREENPHMEHRWDTYAFEKLKKLAVLNSEYKYAIYVHSIKPIDIDVNLISDESTLDAFKKLKRQKNNFIKRMSKAMDIQSKVLAKKFPVRKFYLGLKSNDAILFALTGIPLINLEEEFG